MFYDGRRRYCDYHGRSALHDRRDRHRGWIATIVGIITSTPLFMIGVVIMFVGVAVGLVSRLLHL